MAPPPDDGRVSPHSERSNLTATSPSASRTPSRHNDFASGRDQGLSESFQSTDTVRRRPEPSYGTVQSPTQPTPPSHHLGEPTPTDRPHHYRSGTGQSISAVRSPLLGPDRGRGRGLRKPPMARRASSNAQAPHRGEIFSVDDALDEIEADHAERQSSYALPSTMRRRTVAPSLSRVQSSRDSVEDPATPTRASVHIDPMDTQTPAEEEDREDIGDEAEGEETERIDDDEDDDDLSDAESFTLRDRQQAINETHPFGIRLWKPALYKKDRSVQKTAEVDIHSSPGLRVNSWLLLFNIVWTLCFGWWMALIAFAGAVVCLFFAVTPSGREYGRVLWGLASYLFYPFGKFIRLEQQEAYADEDQGEGRSISEYEQWQSGDLEYGRLFFGPDRGNRSIIGRSRRSIDSEPSETDSLLGRHNRGQTPDSDAPRMKRRLFGRGQWNIGRVVFFLFFYLLITPSLFVVSGICWFLVFWIPMGKVTMLLFHHLRRHPLALSFESDISSARAPMAPHSSIIVCTYRAVGLKYWKYTIDGTNIFLINLMAVVMFVVFDYLVLAGPLHIDNFITSKAFLFIAGLFSIIPLAYFIGQAVASISAQSSMGVGAAINAFFSTIVEVFLYCVALSQGKGQLVEGSIVGSIFAGVLFLPGLSMCFGAIKRKTQRFNAKSAGVTSTMLLFAVIGAFGPTLFYQIYGTHELKCVGCVNDVDGDGSTDGSERDCRRCFFSQTPALGDRFYLSAVRPYCYMAAGMLFLSYIIGLWFTLRTHAAVIWNTEMDEKKQEEPQPSAAGLVGMGRSMGDSTSADVRESHLYRRILGQSLKQVGLQPGNDPGRNGSTSAASASASAREQSFSGPSGPGNGAATTPHVVPPKDDAARPSVHIPGFTDAENNQLVQQVTEIAATAATFAARDARMPRRISHQGHPAGHGTVASSSGAKPTPVRTATFRELADGADPTAAAVSGAAQGGHDAPNWSRVKSSVILCGATLLYAIIAEILVDSVDFVLEGYKIDEKFLGITLFALVPNTTEFLNAISFAMNGNIALSMEIGSAYALQVCLLQIPALVLFSAAYPVSDPQNNPAAYTFSLLFPQWDMVTVILCVFLLSYMYGEGKSNYFKGSILLLSYLVVIVGFYFSGFIDDLRESRFDEMGSDGKFHSYNFKTVGRGTSGRAF